MSVDPAHIESIVQQHSGLVYKIARSVARRYGFRDEIDDLVQEGHIGLIKAAGEFDPSQGVQFQTYAWRKIEGEMLHYLRDRTGVVRPPRSSWMTYQANIIWLDGLGEDSTIRSEILCHDDPELTGVEDTLDRVRLRARLRTLLSRLPPKKRLIIILHGSQGISYSGIGRIIGHSEKQVNQTWHKAKRELRELCVEGGISPNVLV